MKTKSGTALDVYLTYQATNAIAVIYLGVMGSVFYIYQEAHSTSIVNPPLYLRSELLERFLIYPMIFYQFHSLVLFIVAPIPELGRGSMFAHHLVTLLLGVFSIYPQAYLQGYSVFFFGIVELSTFFLQGIDLYKNIRYTKLYDEDAFQRFQILFAISFVSLRVALWPLISTHFWTNASSLLMNGKAHSDAIVMFSLAANAYLTLLQFYWGTLIVHKLYNHINNSENHQIFLYNFTHITTILVSRFQTMQERFPGRSQLHVGNGNGSKDAIDKRNNDATRGGDFLEGEEMEEYKTSSR